MRKEYDFSKGIRGKYIKEYNMSTKKVKAPVAEDVEEQMHDEWNADHTKGIENELEDLGEELREFDDETIQKLDDLVATARCLAASISAVTTEVSEAHDRLFTKVRNLKGILERTKQG